MIRASLSYTALLGACSYWAAPDAEWGPNDGNAETEGGNLVHAALASMVDTGAATLATDDAGLIARFNHGCAWMRANIDDRASAEVPFAYDVVADTGRVLPSDGHRDYSQRTATEVPGTADLFAMGEDEGGPFVWVADWKCVFGGHKKSARAQLEALALAAARARGVDRARCVTLYLDGTGVDDWTERFELDAFDFVRIGATLGRALPPFTTPTPGDHCTERYCPALAACPATQAGLVPLLPATALVRPTPFRYVPAIESPDHLAWMLAARPVLRKALEQVDSAIDGYVKDGPVETTDGRTIKATFRTMPRMNTKALEQLARDKGATDEDVNGCIRASVEGNGVRISGGKKGKAA